MVKVISRSENEVTVEVSVRLDGSLLEMEAAIQEATNAVGCCVTEEALKSFDADGSPIRIGETKLTARGRDPKEYQTPYGVVEVERYVYQTSRGGRIYCPLEHQARIVRGATPFFASQISHKYAQLSARGANGSRAESWSEGGPLLYVLWEPEAGNRLRRPGATGNGTMARIEAPAGAKRNLSTTLRHQRSRFTE